MWCEVKAEAALLFLVVGQNVRIKINLKSTSRQETTKNVAKGAYTLAWTLCQSELVVVLCCTDPKK